jgi:PAS domain S-box-containing protein
MDKRLLTPGSLLPYFFWSLLLAGLFVTSRYSYLLFHSIVGFFSVVIASGVFAIAWNTRDFQENNYLLFLGIAYLFVGALDLLYTLSYQSLGLFPGFSQQAPGQLWVAARTLESLSLFLAPQFIGRRLRAYAVFGGYLLAFAAIILVIFLGGLAPLETLTAGPVLTALQKTGKYLNSILLVGAMAVLWHRRQEVDPAVLRLLLAAIALALGSEVTLTFIAGISQAAGLAGQLVKLAALYLIYRALIASELIKPYVRLSHSLKVSGDLIRQEKDFTDRLLDLAQEIMLILDSEGRILRLNHTCEALTGYRLAEIQNRRFWEVFPAPEEVPEVQEAFFDLIAGDFTQSWQTDWVAKDGTRRLIAWSNTAFPRENGTVEYVIGTGLDISDQRDVQNRLEQLNGKLTQQIEIREPEPQLRMPAPTPEPESFTAAGFTDLRVPVRWLKGYCRVLEEYRGSPLDPKGREYLQRMQGVISQMGELIAALRQQARLDQAKMQRQEVNLSAQARLIAAELSRRDPHRRVVFAITQGLRANGDPALLHAALFTLLNQAWKFTEGLLQSRIEFGALPPENGERIFFVQDNRRAFGIDQVNKLFRSLRQMQAARDFSGLQIGLSTVRSIILRHGGRLWAAGEIGQGVTFYFTLPRSSSE